MYPGIFSCLTTRLDAIKILSQQIGMSEDAASNNFAKMCPLPKGGFMLNPLLFKMDVGCKPPSVSRFSGSRVLPVCTVGPTWDFLLSPNSFLSEVQGSILRVPQSLHRHLQSGTSVVWREYVCSIRIPHYDIEKKSTSSYSVNNAHEQLDQRHSD